MAKTIRTGDAVPIIKAWKFEDKNWDRVKTAAEDVLNHRKQGKRTILSHNLAALAWDQGPKEDTEIRYIFFCTYVGEELPPQANRG